MKPTLVLVHGAWMSPASWEPWVERYRARGHEVLAPAWPYDDRPVAELRESPRPELAGVGVGEIVAAYAAVVQALPEPPILIGHSFGGLFVQMLLDRGLGRAGVAIDPAPPRGVTPTPDAVRAGLGVVTTWSFWNRVIHLSFGDFAWGWMHDAPEAEQRRVFDTYVVPTPGRVYAQALASPATRVLYVDFANAKRPPLLLCAGLEDRTVPASMVRQTYELQKRSGAVTAYREFPGRTHWIVGQPGWEEVADAALDWALAPTPS